MENKYNNFYFQNLQKMWETWLLWDPTRNHVIAYHEKGIDYSIFLNALSASDHL